MENAVIELDLRARMVSYILVRNHRYEHPTANFLGTYVCFVYYDL
jgi:hypothetical protein